MPRDADELRKAQARLQWARQQRQIFARQADPGDHQHLRALGKLRNDERRARSDVAFLSQSKPSEEL